MSRLTSPLNKIKEIKTSKYKLDSEWIISDIRFDGLPTAELRFDVVDLEVFYDKAKEEFQATLDFVGGHEEEISNPDINEAIKEAVGDFLDFSRLPKIPQEIVDKLYKGEF